MFSGSPLKILVLDDDLPFLESFRDLLAQDGHCVWPATRGQDAVELVRSVALDLSFLDFELPDIDGLQAFEEIHRRCPDLPAVFISGNPPWWLERKVLGLGAFGLMRKPFEPRALRVLIQKAVFGTSSFDGPEGDTRWRS